VHGVILRQEVVDGRAAAVPRSFEALDDGVDQQQLLLGRNRL
jgi:hypothetical protein